MNLLPYQKEGVKWLLEHPHALLADEMGLGKTVQAIELLNQLGEAAWNFLIVCPASLKLNWLREWQRWGRRPDLKIGIVAGSNFPNDCHIVIINYDILERHRKLLNAREWHCLICDEAQNLKNPKAIRTKMICGGRGVIPLSSRRKVLLTGTPILNRPIELYSLISYLNPEGWGSRHQFAMRYCNPQLNPWSGGWDYSGAANLEELHVRLRASGTMLRRKKADVLTELPPKRRQIVPIEVKTAEQRDALKHESTVRGKAKSWEDAPPELFYEKSWFESISLLRHEVARSKIPDIVEYLKDTIAEVGKAVCFAHHKDVIQGIAEHFGKNVVTLTGETTMAKRQEAVDSFQHNPSTTLFLGNIQAAGVGLTLTAASTVVFAELDWVPGNLTQAEDRCHRIGQKKSVNVYHLVLNGSLDAYMVEKLIEKQDIIDRAVDLDPELAEMLS